MVMHASKLPRLSDGFHDRNEAHPYQTSVDKYPSKSLNSGGTNSEHGTSKDRDREKSQLHPTQHREMPASGMRHTASPSTGSSRPGSESGSPRTYRNKSSYLQRQRDRQQRGSSTSPAENTFNNQAHHGSNSHSGDAKNSHEQHIKTILAKANEWTEHISSSGKKYYYNCKTEVSQWEKPKEWIERERLKRVVNASEKIPAKDSPKPVNAVDSRQAKSSNEKHSSDSNRDRPTSHQSQTQHSSDRHSHDSSYSVSSRRQEEYYSGSRHNEKSSSNTSSSSSKPSTTTSSSSSSSITSGSNNNSGGGHGHSSRNTPSRSTPSSTSTPTQSPYGRSQHHQQQLYHQTDGGAREHRNRTEHKGHEVLKSPSSGPSGGPSPSPGPSPGPGVGGLQMGGSSLSLATDMYGRLKSLVPQQQGSRSGEKLESPRVQGTPSPGPATASPVTSKSHTSNQHSQSLHPPSAAAQRLFTSSQSPSVDRNSSATTTQQQAHSQQQGDRTDNAHDRLSNPSPMSIDSVSDLSSPAPSQTDPSPRPQQSTPVSQQQQTYSSQTQQTLTTATVSQAQNSVTTSVSAAGGTKQLPHVNQQKPSVDEDGRPPQASPTLSRKSVSPTHSVSSQSGQVTTPHKSPAAIATALASAPLKPITATITPSLIQHYNESLTRHAQNWAADHAERQANRFHEESLTLGAEYTSQISVDLKFARSLVRASEIQATLQEQRILFLRQQAKDLEKLKSENAYMT